MALPTWAERQGACHGWSAGNPWSTPSSAIVTGIDVGATVVLVVAGGATR